MVASRVNLSKQRLKRDMALMLIELRASLGLSQVDFAKKIKKKRESVSRWESGKHFVSMETLCDIAAELDDFVIPAWVSSLDRPVAYRKYLNALNLSNGVVYVVSSWGTGIDTVKNNHSNELTLGVENYSHNVANLSLSTSI